MSTLDDDNPILARSREILKRTEPTEADLEEFEERRSRNRLERIMNPPPPPVIRKVQENALVPRPRPVTLALVRRETTAAMDALIDVLLPKIQAALDTRAMVADLTALSERVAALEKPRVRVKAGGERLP